MFLLALASVAGALGVAFAPSTVIAAAALTGMVASNAALFWLWQTPWLAAAQLLGYGAMVAGIFHVAYWQSHRPTLEKPRDGRLYWASLLSLLFLILLVRVLGGSAWGSAALAHPLTFDLGHSLGAAAALLVLGLFGAVTQRDGIRVWMSLEVALNAALLNLVAFGHFLHPQRAGGSGLTLAVMGIGVAQALVGMRLLRALFVRRDTMDLEAFDEVRG